MNAIKEVKKNEKTAVTVTAEKKETPAVIPANTTTEAEQKKEVVNFLEKYKPEAPKSAESRIDRMKQFEALSTRYNLLKEKDNELKTFQAGNDKLGAKVIFKNAQGFEFTVQNSNVIQKLVEAGTQELSILKTEAENEVLTFEI